MVFRWGAFLPVRIAMISAQIEIAVSSGVLAPRSSPIGDMTLSNSFVVTPASMSLSVRFS